MRLSLVAVAATVILAVLLFACGSGSKKASNLTSGAPSDSGGGDSGGGGGSGSGGGNSGGGGGNSGGGGGSGGSGNGGGSTGSGWPFSTGAWQNFVSPAIGDVDGDGTLDLVFGGWDGKIRCVDARGQEKWNLYLSDDPQLPYYQPQLHSSPTLIDLDGNPSTLEIVVAAGLGSLNGRVYILSSVGAVLARFNAQSDLGSPLVVDTNHDGVFEVYIGEFFSPYTFYSLDIVNQSGTLSFQQRWVKTLTDGGTLSAAAAADLVGDSDLEIIVAASGTPNTDIGGKKVYALRNDGSEFWTFSTTRFNNYNSPTIADLDGDGHLEVLQASTDGFLYCLDGATGVLRWSFRIDGQTGGFLVIPSIMHTQAVADLDHDGHMEILVGAYNCCSPNYLYCLNDQGIVRWQKTYLDTKMSFSSPSIGDLDGDGELEIVIGTAMEGSGTPYLFAYDRFGNELWSAPQPGTVYSSPALADLDGDGKLEIAFGIYNSQYNCLRFDGTQFNPSTLGAVTDPKPWPMWHRNTKNTRN